jgi:hypothetical protein
MAGLLQNFAGFVVYLPKNESHPPKQEAQCVEALGNGALRDNR